MLVITKICFFLLVIAFTKVTSETDGAVRLEGGTASQGRVEVYLDGEWSTVCDESWDEKDGRVVCRQLGFDNVSMTTMGAFFGQGEGEVLFSGLECTGNENNLTECPQDGRINCHHNRDAGVICWPPSNEDDGGLSTGVIAAIVFVPFFLLIIVILCIIIILLYLTLTYDRDARDIQERHYQAKRFKAGIKLKDAKRVRSRRQSNDSYLAERNIPRLSLGEGIAHPWQDDEEANSEIGDAEVFIVESQEQQHAVAKGEVRQRVVSALNPMALQVNAEMEREHTQAKNEQPNIPVRYQKKQTAQVVMSDEEIDKEFNLDIEDDEYDDDDINPYED